MRNRLRIDKVRHHAGRWLQRGDLREHLWRNLGRIYGHCDVKAQYEGCAILVGKQSSERSSLRRLTERFAGNYGCCSTNGHYCCTVSFAFPVLPAIFGSGTFVALTVDVRQMRRRAERHCATFGENAAASCMSDSRKQGFESALPMRIWPHCSVNCRYTLTLLYT